MTREPTRPEGIVGCPSCVEASADAAWDATRRVRVGTVIEESHFSVRVTACECGQRFGVVFAERVDWSGGDDDQTWLVVPVSHEESERVLEEGETALARAASGRRFLVRTYPTSGGVSVAWRRGGFSIPTHD